MRAKNSKNNKPSKKVPILQYDLENTFIKEWESVSAIYEAFNVNGGGTISKCCTGKLKKAYGFI